MNRKLLAVIAAVTSLTVINTVSAEETSSSNWYIKGAGSFHRMQKQKASSIETFANNSTEEIQFNSKMKDTFGGNFALGKKIDSFRVEVEASISSLHKAKNMKPSKLIEKSASGTTTITHNPNIANFEASLKLGNISIMVNGFYDFAINEEFDWYVGLGVGPCISRLKYQERVGNSFSKESNVKATIGAQAMTGVSYHLTNNVSLIAGYKVFITPKVSFSKSPNLWGGTSHVKLESIPVTHSVEVGARYSF